MFDSEARNFYEVLDLSAGASTEEIRLAYERIRRAYVGRGLAGYSIIEDTDRDKLLREIDEAFETLSSPERRERYDRSLGNVTTIQRVEESELLSPTGPSEGDELLVPPPTDFTASLTAPPQEPLPLFKAPRAPSSPPPMIGRQKTSFDPDLLIEITQQREWHGQFLKKLREALEISIEELSATTKVSKSFLLALEEDNYSRLPAPVYLRGFLVQIAKALRVSPEPLAHSYVSRYETWLNQKSR